MRLYLVSLRDRAGSSHPAERSTAASPRVREIGGCFVSKGTREPSEQRRGGRR